MFFWIAVLALAISFASVGPLLNFLREAGFTAKNFKGSEVPVGTGLLWGWVLLACTALIGLVGTLVGDVAGLINELYILAALVAGVTLLGFIDDTAKTEERGLRSHIRAFFNGKITSGFLKATGGLVISLIIATHFTSSPQLIILNALIIGLFMNFINLLDLRPGRALVTFIILANMVMVASFFSSGMSLSFSWAFWGIILAPASAIFLSEIRGQSMLGDTGSNTLGAVLGYVVIANFETDIKVAVLIFLLAFNFIADRVSITKLLERGKV